MKNKTKFLIIGDPHIGSTLSKITEGTPDIVLVSGDTYDLKTLKPKISISDMISDSLLEDTFEPIILKSPTNPYERNKNFKRKYK